MLIRSESLNSKPFSKQTLSKSFFKAFRKVSSVISLPNSRSTESCAILILFAREGKMMLKLKFLLCNAIGVPFFTINNFRML
jgi:hypothetical protein